MDNCPNCNKAVDLSSKNTFRPFCSERCRSLDLSNWLSEKNVISTTFDSKVNYD